MSDTLLSSFTTNTGDVGLAILHPDAGGTFASAVGIAFTAPMTAYSCTSCKFLLKKFTGSPTGNAHARLYAATSATGYPTGSALASSPDFDVSTLTGGYQTLEFTWVTPYTLSPGANYCVIFENPTSGTIDTSNYPSLACETPIGTGKGARFISSAWGEDVTYKVNFYVYGKPVVKANNFASYLEV